MNKIPFFCITQPISRLKLGFKEGKIKGERGKITGGSLKGTHDE
jgi:hypothetical protein